MEESRSAYRIALKATSIFGGVQIFNILIRVIRSKFVAVLLGPSGMGIFGLLYSSVEMISSLTCFGLGQSAVKNIAEANGANDKHKLEIVVTVFRKLIWYTGLLGALICALFSPYWSQITFGNKDYTIEFVLISIAVLLQQLTSGNISVLQGLQKYKDLAKANIYGSIVGLLVTVPLYYIWGKGAIVPVLILTYVISYICAFFIARRYPIRKVKIENVETKLIAKDILKLGLLMSMSGLLSQLAAYLVRIFISNYGSLEDVGFYNAGFAIVNTYVGLVFTAMATEYYPRLASKTKDDKEFVLTIRQQTEIVLLLLIPLATAFIVFIRPIVLVLYTSKFISIEGMIYWAIAAMVFKALAWSLSFGLVTKGEMKAFSICEFSAIIYGFIFNIIGYITMGISGLGVSFLAMYLCYFLHVYHVSIKKIGNAYNRQVLKLTFTAIGLILFVLSVKLTNNEYIEYSLGLISTITAMYFSYKELEKRISISSILSRKYRK